MTSQSGRGCFKACSQMLVRAERDSFLEERERRTERVRERYISVPWVLSPSRFNIRRDREQGG